MAQENTKKNTIAIPDAKTKRKRALVFVIVSACIITAFIFFLFWFNKLMFKSNPRLTFRELQVSSSGYWHKKDNELIRLLKLKRNVNIFELDLKKIRMQLRNIPSVENAQVFRILPDTLRVDITERMPRAFINYPYSRWVVDENAVVMERRHSMAAKINLPQITGVPHAKLAGGDRLPEIKHALDLIGTVLRNFPDMEMQLVSVSDPEQLDFYIRYRNGRTYRVLMPTRNRGLDFMLNALQSAIIHAYQLGDERTTYNLSFDGQVVIN